MATVSKQLLNSISHLSFRFILGHHGTEFDTLLETLQTGRDMEELVVSVRGGHMLHNTFYILFGKGTTEKINDLHNREEIKSSQFSGVNQ